MARRPTRIAPYTRRARRAAARRAMHALQLRRRIAEQIEVRDAMPFRCARRELAKLRLFALACRADAWEALAAGDAAMAAAHRRDARRFAALARAVTVGG